MKKVIISIVATLLVLLFICQMGWLIPIGVHPFSFGREEKEETTKTDVQFDSVDGIKYRVMAKDDSFYLFKNGKWQKETIKGVNIGAGAPGLFPGELSISYEQYYKWFEQISEMNANCVRVYTTMRPQFYKALYDFNTNAENKNKVYFMQGVWMDENDIASLNDVYAENEKIYNEFMQDAKNVADAIHGNITLPERAGFASGTYTADVSPYFAGWLVGIEWDPTFVQNTNDNNQDKKAYDGKYLYASGSTPFEAFLAKVGDQIISYETGKYKFQAPLAFSNWVTTDPLSHPNEPHADEDRVTVNTESIKMRDDFVAGEFISYHVYPYYPDTLNYQSNYVDYIDDDGKINTYEAYLKDLKAAHTMPMIIAEFGVPTSRGKTHESVMGYNQGGIDETEVGGMLTDMINSMMKEKYAGFFIFTWQDEWFKRTWNNVEFDVADKRPFWSNIQTSEQNFGILAFDPGETATLSYADKDISEWKGLTPVAANGASELYMNSDSRYVYFMLKSDEIDFEHDTLLIPIDIIDGQGNTKMNSGGAVFDKGADFVISINGKDNSRILVDSYYDAFYFLYGEQYKMLDIVGDIRTKDSGRFNTMQMCYNYEYTVPPENILVPFSSYETGKLKFGNNNPSATDYKSLADFNYSDGSIEIRIPWQLLNVMDPAGKQVMDDFYVTQSITAKGFENFSVGFGVSDSDGTFKNIDLSGTYTYEKWDMPAYHERLKPSYDVLKNALGKIS